MHLPRSTFSDNQLDLLLWLMNTNGIKNHFLDLPSVGLMKTNNKRIHTASGIRTHEYKGALGHRFYVNSLHDIIAQVM